MEAYYAKQPILSSDNTTFAYELLYRRAPVPNSYTGTDGDVSTADVLNNVFFGGNPYQLLDGKKAFVNFTENLLKEGIATLLPKDILVVEILETVSATPEIIASCKQLKDAGYTLALDDYVYSEENKALFPFGDIVKIDFKCDKKGIEDTAKRCREAKKILLAEKVETNEDVAYAKSLGCTLMQGYYFARPLIMTHQTQTPMQTTFLTIISLLQERDPNIEKLDEAISVDAAMAIKLLRLVNTLRPDTSEKIATVRQALVMLGISRIREWIYLVGLQRLTTDQPEEIVTMALIRAKFCEGIAKLIPQARALSKEMYLMGLISIVSGTGNREAIDELPVSEHIKSGLKGERGIFNTIFCYVLAYERAQWSRVDAFNKFFGITEETLSQLYLDCMTATNELDAANEE